MSKVNRSVISGPGAQIYTKEPIAWAIRKNDPDFFKFLNDFLFRMKADGRFDQIYHKWFRSMDWYKFAR